MHGSFILCIVWIADTDVDDTEWRKTVIRNVCKQADGFVSACTLDQPYSFLC